MSDEDVRSGPGLDEVSGVQEERVRGLGRPKGAKNKTPAQILAKHHGSDCYVDVVAPLRPHRAKLREMLQ